MKLPVDYTNINQQQRKLVREEYIREQGGLCYHCGNPLNNEPTVEVMNKWINTTLFPPNFLQSPVHLHHNYENGLTIGAVHSRCNAVLWQYHGE